MCDKRFWVVAIALFLGLVASPGRAELLVYEPFDYPPGALDGLDGGTGWITPWEDADSALEIEAGSLLGALATRQLE